MRIPVNNRSEYCIIIVGLDHDYLRHVEVVLGFEPHAKVLYPLLQLRPDKK
jgi:hypothetical protein